MNWADNAIIGLLTQIKDKPSGGSPSGDAAVTDVVLGKTFDSATAGAGATGTLVVPNAPTGNAAVGDVASGKTFSSALLNGATGTSTKNATVPNDAPIQPAQAYVDNIEVFAQYARNNAGTAIINLANKSIISIDADFLSGWANKVALDNQPQFNLSGNLMASSVNINAIIAGLKNMANMAAQGGILDISGGTNAAPTLPIIVVDFNNLDITGNTHCYGKVTPSVFDLICFDNTFNLADTIVSWDASNASTFMDCGTQDSPTKQQIINKLVALGAGKIVDMGGLIIRISPTDHALEPFDFTAMTGSSLTQGNNNIGTLLQNSWTITTN